MSQPYFILRENDLQNASKRLRKAGCTRFHLAVREDKSMELIDWANSGAAPLMRRSRDGNYPFCDFLKVLGAHRSEHAKPIGEMPEWWAKYADWGGEQGWIAHREKMRCQQKQADQMLSKLFLEGIDWAGASEDFKDAIRQALPSNLNTKDGAGDIIDAALKAGLVLSPFEHQGIPMTMAMWSVLRPIRDSNVAFWLDREAAVDPPGKGPGFLSLVVACWKGSYRQPADGESWIRKANELGADIHRPAVKAREKERFSFDEMILEPADEHEKTILGQAQQSNDPILLQALGALPQTRSEQLETYHGMVNGLAEEAGKWRESTNRDARINDLLLILAQNVPEGFVADPHPTAVAARKKLLLDVASNLPLSHFPRLGELLEHTLSPNDRRISPDFYRTSMRRAMEHLDPEDLVAWMRLVEERMQPEHQPADTVGMLVELLCSYGDYGHADGRVDKVFHAIDSIHDGHAIGENTKIEGVIFGFGIRSVTLLEAVLRRLDTVGYRPSQQGWEKLAKRLSPEEDKDGKGYPAENRVELEAIIRYLKDKGIRASSDVFEQISNPLSVEGSALNGAYCRQGRWDTRQIWQVREMALEAMIANHGDLDCQDGKPVRSPIEAVLAGAARARRQGDGAEQQLHMLMRLVDAGAMVDIEKPRDLESGHPYWEIAAYYQHKLLDAATSSGPGRARSSRL